MKSLPEQLKSAKRELALRQSVYPKWTREGRKSQEESTHEIECQKSIVATLEKLLWLAQASDEMKSQSSIAESPAVAS